MLVKELMTRKVELVEPNLSLKEAAEKMKNKDIGALPVGENDRLVGMLTDRDIAIRGVANGKDANQTKVRDCMTSEINYCYEDQTLEEVGKLMMVKKIRRLPVLNKNKKLVGICSLDDMAVKSGNPKLAGEVLKQISEKENRPHLIV